MQKWIFLTLLVTTTSIIQKTRNETIKERIVFLNTNNTIVCVESKQLKWYGLVECMSTERWLEKVFTRASSERRKGRSRKMLTSRNSGSIGRK